MNVTVSAPTGSDLNEITGFELTDQTDVDIDDTTSTITVTVPDGTNLNTAPSVLNISPNATVTPAIGDIQDFSQPVVYTVTAENGDPRLWTVSVTVTNSSEKSIDSFVINGISGTINGTEISLTLPSGTNVTALSPIIEFFGQSVVPSPGTPTDFTNDVVYTVTAEDTSTLDYTVIVTVQADTNTAPTAGDFAVSFEQGSNNNNIDLSPHINDGDGDALTVTVTTAPPNGTATVSGTTIVYTPNPGHNGADAIGYSVNDSNGGTATATVSVTVNAPANTVPTAGDFAVSFEQDSNNNNIDLSPHINDGDGDALTVTVTTAPPNGTATVSGTTIVYTPNPDYNGADAIGYMVNDGNGGTATATASLTVNAPANTVPTAANFAVSFEQDSNNNNIDLSPHINDGDGDALTVTVTTAPPNGTATVSGTAIVYTPNPGHNGADAIGYSVNDGNGGTATATVSVTVNAPANIAPVAVDDTYTIDEAGNLNVLILTNDTDNEGDDLTVNWVGGSPANIGQTIGGSDGGLFTITAGGNLTFDTNGEFDSLNDGDSQTTTVQYRITDGNSNSNIATVTVSVTGVDDPNNNPTAFISSDVMSGTTPLSVNFKGDQSDDSDGSITSYFWDFGENAQTSTLANPTYEYVSPGEYIVTLMVTDNDGATDSDTIRITVSEPTNGLPTAVISTSTTTGTTPLSINFIGENSYDNDGSIVSYEWDFGENGQTSTIANPTYEYVSPGEFTVILVVTDNLGATDSDRVTITVSEPSNEQPTANAGPNQTITLPANEVVLDGSGSSDTAPGTIDTYAWTQVNGPGTANIVSANSESTRVSNLIQGTYTFELTVVDNGSPALNNTDRITIIVKEPISQPPTATFSGSRNVSIGQPSVSGTVTISNGPMTFNFGMTSFGSESGTITLTISGSSYTVSVQGGESQNRTLTESFPPGTYNYSLTLNGSGNYSGGVTAQQL
ncbi:Ig-like domain-containing protein [Zobellia roscoffensis]